MHSNPSPKIEARNPTSLDAEDTPMAEASADSGLAVLGGGMRRMVDLVNRLRASWIEDLGLPLPRIAVVGNQSAGKSSLIEAISGVSLFVRMGGRYNDGMEANVRGRNRLKCRDIRGLVLG